MVLDSDTDSEGPSASMSAQTFEAVYMVKADPVRAQSVASEYRAAIKAAIVEVVPIEIAWKLLWAKKSVSLALEIQKRARTSSAWQGCNIFPRR